MTRLKTRAFWAVIAVGLASFIGGRWSRADRIVRADSGDSPQIDVRQITGSTSMVVYYPNLKKAYVYQSPFVGLPTWPCAYSIQLSTPGGTIDRQPCPGR